jgi:hypothetical protein
MESTLPLVMMMVAVMRELVRFKDLNQSLKVLHQASVLQRFFCRGTKHQDRRSSQHAIAAVPVAPIQAAKLGYSSPP